MLVGLRVPPAISEAHTLEFDLLPLGKLATVVERGALAVQELVLDRDTVNLQRVVRYWDVEGGIPHEFTYDPAVGDVD